MTELFVELLSEEIPARMQRTAAADLERLLSVALAPISPQSTETWFGPRRIAMRAEVAGEVEATSTIERGPRINAPEQALAGFLRKHGAERKQLRQEGDYWVLEKRADVVSATALIAGAMPGVLRRFPWPKSMRWGASSRFVWVRPLRRIICILDGAVIPFDLRDGNDDGHGLGAGNETEGHRFHAPGAFAVSGAKSWRRHLLERRVVVDAEDRKRVIADRIAALAAENALAVVDDPGLLEEVAGLVEWPVPYLGRIADEHMDLPPEVMQVSMRVNQRYFALRTEAGAAAPWFAFVANIEADDGGVAIVAGNERVLRARFADARHFWDLDRKATLESRITALDAVTYHAKLGTQGQRVRKLMRLAAHIAPLVGADAALAERAAMLAKADLVSGMVGEFPELQGVMGRYYALHDGEDQDVADAIRDHYAPRGPGESPPSAPVSMAVALADKFDQLCGFFAIGETPTGSGDPYALRRAALGAIRIIREHRLRLRLRPLLEAASDAETTEAVFAFIIERLVMQLRAEGARHDILNAVFGAKRLENDDDLVALLDRAEAVGELLLSADGQSLLAGYKRAANILRIEERKDGPHTGPADPDWLTSDDERSLQSAADALAAVADETLRREDYRSAMRYMARIRAPLDAFFDKVTVNAPEPELRSNRLRLLNQTRSILDQIADFSRIEG
jgi:glycyl-tRNA synthetase beta chain